MRSKLVVALPVMLLATIATWWTTTSSPDVSVATARTADGIELIDRPSAAPTVAPADSPAGDAIRRGIVAGDDGRVTWPSDTWAPDALPLPSGSAEPAPPSSSGAARPAELPATTEPAISARVVAGAGGIVAATAAESAARGRRFVPGGPPTATTTTVASRPPGPTTTVASTPSPTSTTSTSTSTTTTSTTTTTTTSTTTTTAPPSTTFDLSLDRFYINQAVPVLDTAAPAAQRIQPVARRGGLARAFVSANRSNTVRPEVELHWRHPNGTNGVVALTSPSSTPTDPSEGTLGSTFNREFGTNVLRPGTEVFVVVDPRNRIAEANENNNRWPASGWADARVADVPTLEITWIPVIWNGQQGNIDAGNVAQFEDRTLRMMPIPGIDSEIHAPIVFNGDLSTGAGWTQLLRQVAQLRAAEGSDRAYHAIVKRPGNQGIAGIGYIGLEVAVSFDDLRGASDVVAHELGHNFGLEHAPCGPVGDSDPLYPYAGGRIGSWGYDVVGDVVYDPGSNVRDVMSYCSPTWISDFHYRNVLQNRLARAAQQAQFEGPALHVSGNIDDDVAAIDPAYSLRDGGVRPTPGRYSLIGADANGDRLFAVPFAAHEGGLHGGEHHDVEDFSFSVPVTDDVLRRLASLTVEIDGVAIGERRAATGLGGVVSAEQEAMAGGTTVVTWDTDAEIAIVRHAITHEVFAVTESGRAEIAMSGSPVEVVLSDGMGSTASGMVEP